MITETRFNAIVSAMKAAGRTIISHVRLKPGHVFRPRFYGSALRMSKSERRSLMGLAASKQGKDPLPKRERQRLRRRDGAVLR